VKSDEAGFFEKLLRFSFLLSGLVGFLRLYGAVAQQPDILLFSGERWLPAYLMMAGGLMGLLNTTLWILLKRGYSLPVWLPTAGVGLNILSTWIERLLLWAPAQRSTNSVWVVGTHLIWLLLAGLGFLQQKRRKHEHNQSGD